MYEYRYGDTVWFEIVPKELLVGVDFTIPDPDKWTLDEQQIQLWMDENLPEEFNNERTRSTFKWRKEILYNYFVVPCPISEGSLVLLK